MRQISILLLFLLLACLPAAALAAGITPAQVLDIQQVGSADISPDGKWAAYTVRENRSLDDKAGGGWSRLYVVATNGGKPRPFLTGEVSVGSPKFSPDGRTIGFTMTRGEKAKSQVWVIPLNGGEAQAATNSKTGVGAWSWSHDGAAIFFVDTEEGPADEKTLKEKGWLPRYYEENLKHRILCRVPFTFGVEPSETENLVEGMAVWGLHVGPKGKYIAFGASEKSLTDHRYMFQDIHLLDLETGEHCLAVDVPGKLGNYRISPDGKRLAWTAAASRSDHAVSSMFFANLDGSNATNQTGDEFEGHIRHVEWRDDQTLLFLADEGVYPTISLQSIKKKPGDRMVLFSGEGNDLIVGMPATQPGLKKMVMVGHNGTTPRELYGWSGKGSPHRLTRHNEWLADVELGEQKVIRWTARDGLELEGILMLPIGAGNSDPSGKSAPLIVDVHGGPEANERNGWLTRYANPGQAMCAKGYAVFFPNYRGSTGRGVKFAASAFAEPAGAEFDDIVDGVDSLIAEGIADKNRVGVMGGSYGGYAANWLATYYSDRFAAGVAFVGISDLVSKRFLTDIPFEDQYVHMGEPVRESWELMLERSPIRYADKCRTPLLILHGENDPRVHPSQSQEMYRALKMADHPSVRLVFYPGEGHGNRKRFGREDALHRMMAWFDHYLLESNPWDGPMPALDISKEMGLIEEEEKVEEE